SDSAGVRRCYPDNAFTDAFSDSACTTPAVRAGVGCSAPPTVAITGSFSASGGDYVTAYAVGPALPAGYLKGASCLAAGDGAGYYTLGAAMPDSMFVAASMNVVPLNGGFARAELVGEDGSTQAIDGAYYQGDGCAIVATGPT